VPVVGAHGTAPLLTDPASGLMAHHLIDDPGWDAGVLEPGRECMPKIVGAAQIHGLQQGVAGRWQCQPPLLSLLTDLGDQARSHELAQGDLNRGWPDGPAAVGERGGEPVGGLWAARPERLEHAGGGGPQLAGGVGQLGQRRVVGAVEVVARQHGAGALWHPGPAVAAWAAARAGEDQGGRVAARWQLPADGRDDLGGQGKLADAGVTLGRGLKPLPNRPA
jgi:hypothetical protein